VRIAKSDCAHLTSGEPMARRRRLTDDALDEDDELPSSRRARRRNSGGRRWKLLFVLVALVVLLLAAPTIIAKSPLRNTFLGNALPPGAGRLTASDAAFSWTGGQALAGVAYLDAKGSQQFAAELIHTSRSLIGFLSNRNDLGTLTITRPILQIETRDGGSSVEDLVAQLADAAAKAAQDPTSGPSEPKSFELAIIDGTIIGRDLSTGQQWQISGLSATAKPLAAGGWDVMADGAMKLGSPAVIPAAANGQLAGGPRPPGAAPTDAAAPLASAIDQAGRFKIHLAPAAAANGTGGGDAPARKELLVVADRLPLAPLEPWLARVVPGARLTGEASPDLTVTWANVAPGSAGGLNDQATQPAVSNVAQPPGEAGGYSNVTAKGKIDAANLRFTSHALAGDLLELATVAVNLDAALVGDRLLANACTARGDWLQAELNGEFNLDEIQRLSLKSLPTSDATITARAELPQLTRMLPRTLRLRPGVRVDAGSIEITARSAKTAAARNWTVGAALQDLVGTDGQRPIRWTKPFEIGVDAIDTADGPQLQRALLRSTFASATADGTAGGLEGELQFNLDELAEELGQFQDLSAWKLHGTGAGKFSLRDTGVDRFAVSAELDLQQIDVQREGKVVWNDPQVRVEIQAAGSRLDFQPQRIETATVMMRGPADTLTAELLEPINLVDANRSWFLKINGNGPLEQWAGRLRPWVAGVPEQLAGQSTISAQLRAAPGLLQVDQSKISVQNFAAKVGQTQINEQGIEAAGDFRWEAAARQFASKAYQLSSSSIAFGTRDVSIQFTESGPPLARGDVAFRGDFDRLAAWGDLLGAQSGGVRPRGQFVGRLQLASDAQRATATLNATAEPLQLVNSADGSIAWNEPKVEFATVATYTSANDQLQLTNINLTGKTVRMEGSGGVEQVRTAGVVSGDVNVTYDAAELARLLTTYLGPNVQITGANQARLQATGQLYANSAGLSSNGSAPSPSWGGLERGADATNAVTTSDTPPLSPPPQGEGDQSWNNSPIPGTPSSFASIQQPASSTLPHWSRRWQLATQTGWTAANVFGLPIGPAQLAASIRDGQAQFTPLELTVGPTGKVSLTPRVLLDADPQILELAPGQAITNVAISAEVSDRMLKYAAPIVAGAARTEGSFSFFLNGAQIPLRQPKQGKLDGRLTIHNLAVTPGPMIQNIATLVQQIDALSKNSQNIGQNLTDNLNQGFGNINQGIGSILGAVSPQKPTAAEPIKGITMSEKAIDVTIAEGRVYHKNLEFLIDDVPVRSNGSVGFDETLNLVIEIPIQQKWVGSKPALQSLVGQVIQIPVSGTFAKPQVDNRAVGNFLAQAAQQAAGGIIGEELNKAFDKILKPR
jgi:translocation and assembly module TamB